MANTKLSPLAVPLALWCFGNCPMDSINLETSRSSRRRAPSWPGSWRGPRGSRRRARHPGLARPLQWLFCKISSIAAADSQEPRAPKNNPGRLCIPRSSAGGICAHLGGLARPWGSDPEAPEPAPSLFSLSDACFSLGEGLRTPYTSFYPCF